MEQLKAAKEENTNLKNNLMQYQELDPDELEKIKAESKVLFTHFNLAVINLNNK